MGISGALLILCVYLSILFRSIKLYSNAPEARNMVVVFWGCMLVYIINSIFIEMRYFEFVNSLFFIFAGVICRAGK